MPSSMKNRIKRAAATTVAGIKRLATAARSKYDSMRKGKTAPAAAPTPYVNQNGNRIYKSNNGAVFTKKANGNRNYTPVANGIKKPNNNTVVPITTNNVKTVPNNIRPNGNNVKNMPNNGRSNGKNMSNNKSNE